MTRYPSSPSRLPRAETEEAFRAIHGLRFFDVSLSEYELQVGWYQDGIRAAVAVYTMRGENKAVLTVNLPNEIPEDCAIFRWCASGGAAQSTEKGGMVYVWMAFFALGLFVDTNQRVDAGYVQAYGAVWKLARCPDSGEYRASCACCLAKLTKKYEEDDLRRRARESVVMLREEARRAHRDRR